jgi:hypothetical protein
MRKLKIASAIVLPAIIVVFGLGLYAGWRFFAPPAARVNAQLILTALHDRGFLVTQTYVFDQPVKIEKTSGSALKDFFFGQTITARGSMEVNLGIDLGRVAADDVSVADDSVTVRIPPATLFNSRLVGPVEVKNDQGLLKRLLASDDGYNTALAELSKEAEAAAGREEFLSRANDSAKEDIARILGYVAPGKRVAVEIK